MKYVRIYADALGESHFEESEVEFTVSVSGMDLSTAIPTTRLSFFRAPPGWSGEWAVVPRRRFFQVVCGRAEVVTSDGEARSFGPGDVLLEEDTSGKGHQARVVGTTECIASVVGLADRM